MRNRPARHPVVLPLGREALYWVRQGGTPPGGGWLTQLMYRWQCLWFEKNLALQRLMPPERPMRADPIFILGLWRSGTTYLHDLLGACPGMISPTTAQCLNPASFRLRPPPVGERAVKRPMDGLTIDMLSPQEDEFALLALGVPSVYRGFFDPRRLTELTRWLDPENWTPTQPQGWGATLGEFLSGVADGRSGRLVLKSPGHTFRINALAGLYPGAAYIWLVRDPFETFLSNRKMWGAMFERYALWDFDGSVLDSFLIQAFHHAAGCLRRAVSLVPRDRLAVVAFGQLTGSTLDSLERVNRRLSLGSWTEMQPSLNSTATAREGYRPDTYDMTKLSTECVKAAERLQSAQLEAITSHGV